MTSSVLFNPTSSGGKTPPKIHWLQNVAIFACCANLFSTALASIGFVSFLTMFVWLWFSSDRQVFNTANFPHAVAWGIALYIGWQIVGLIYTEATLSYALKNIFTERKIVYILPLVLIFTDEQPKIRFLRAFLLTCIAGLMISFALTVPALNPDMRFRAAAVLHSHATQGMAFAMAAFLSVWLGHRQVSKNVKYMFYALALAFSLNIALVTPGRSGYVVYIILFAWSFFIRLGIKGLLVGGFASVVLASSAFYLSPSINDRVMLGVTEAQNYATDTTETSLGRRMVMYSTTMDMIREHPILGVGTGGYKQFFSAMAAQRYTGWRAQPFDDPHNQYLFVWAENGIVGLATFLLMLFVIWRKCNASDIYGKMAAGCLLAWCATSLFSGHFRTFPEGHLIAFVIGILMVARSPGSTLHLQKH
ncbi:MAG: O-antigen ligase family protein [Polaromonas sp.]|nr:MAG: O-antigen ligase family protein [Polaromonas sp.]